MRILEREIGIIKDRYTDFDTGNLRYKARERYSFGFSDWRSFYGAEGA